MYRLININCEILTLQPKWMKIIRYICMKDDLQLGKLKENCLLLKLLSHTQENVSELNG